VRHPDVHEHHVRLQGAGEFGGLDAVGRLPTTSMPGSLARITRNPVRTSRWSSAISTEIGSAGAGCMR
jgi:hypothetical protein